MKSVAVEQSPLSVGAVAPENGHRADRQRSTKASYSIGIDLGGTNLRIAAYTGESERLDLVQFPTRVEAGPKAVLQDMAEAARRMHANCREHGEFVGIGVGSPGPIFLPEGKLLVLANFPGFDYLELRAELEKLLELPVIVESDANAAALAEWHLGAGRAHQVDSMAMLTLGTGVGGGLVLGGRVWHGSLGMAGEPGHAVVYPDGLDCPCGTRGCLEQYASATSVRRMAEQAAGEPGGERLARVLAEHGSVQAHHVAALARSGDEASQRIFDTMGTALGRGLGSLVNNLNLPLHTLGGGMAQAWELFAPAMFRAVWETSQVYRLTAPADTAVFEPRRTNLCKAHLGHEAGILGASLLPYFQ